jgi:hypothetical protein
MKGKKKRMRYYDSEVEVGVGDFFGREGLNPFQPKYP